MEGHPGGIEIRARISHIHQQQQQQQEQQPLYQKGDVLFCVGFRSSGMAWWEWEVVADYTIEDTMITLEEAKRALGRVILVFIRPDNTNNNEGEWTSVFGEELQLDAAFVAQSMLESQQQQQRASLGNHLNAAIAYKRVPIGSKHQCMELPVCQPKPPRSNNNNVELEEDGDERDIMLEWTAEEKDEFDKWIYRIRSRDLRLIAQQMGKPRNEVVEYFYGKWKLTPNYIAWNRKQKATPSTVKLGRCDGCSALNSMDSYLGESVHCIKCKVNFQHLECLKVPQPRLFAVPQWQTWMCATCIMLKNAAANGAPPPAAATPAIIHPIRRGPVVPYKHPDWVIASAGSAAARVHDPLLPMPPPTTFIPSPGSQLAAARKRMRTPEHDDS